MIKKVIGALFAAVGVIDLVVIPQKSWSVIAGAVTAFAIAIYFLFISKPRPSNSRNKSENTEPKVANPIDKNNAKLQKLREKAKTEDKNKRYISSVAHQVGLPLAEGTKCSIEYGIDGFKINGGGIDFKLPLEKVTDVSMTTEAEIQKAYISSIGGAVGGAVLFGPLGAMVGGRVKTKEDRSVTNYLVFTYLKEGEVKYIAFDVTSNVSKGKYYVELFKKHNVKEYTQAQEITL